MRRDPDDDALRLVYSDWLEENGDVARAEFIRLQCRLEDMGSEDPEREALLKREKELFTTHGPAWFSREGLKALLPAERIPARDEPTETPVESALATVRRGFVETLRCSPAQLLNHASLLRSEPVETVLLNAEFSAELNERIDGLSAVIWDGIQRLGIQCGEQLTDAVTSLWDRAQFSRLRQIRMSGWRVSRHVRSIIRAKQEGRMPVLSLIVPDEDDMDSVARVLLEDSGVANLAQHDLDRANQPSYALGIAKRLSRAGIPPQIAAKELSRVLRPEGLDGLAREIWENDDALMGNRARLHLIQSLYERFQRPIPDPLLEQIIEPHFQGTTTFEDGYDDLLEALRDVGELVPGHLGPVLETVITRWATMWEEQHLTLSHEAYRNIVDLSSRYGNILCADAREKLARSAANRRLERIIAIGGVLPTGSADHVDASIAPSAVPATPQEFVAAGNVLINRRRPSLDQCVQAFDLYERARDPQAFDRLAAVAQRVGHSTLAQQARKRAAEFRGS